MATLITTTWRCPVHPGSWRSSVREVSTRTPTATVYKAIKANPPPCHCGATMLLVVIGERTTDPDATLCPYCGAMTVSPEFPCDAVCAGQRSDEAAPFAAELRR